MLNDCSQVDYDHTCQVLGIKTVVWTVKNHKASLKPIMFDASRQRNKNNTFKTFIDAPSCTHGWHAVKPSFQPSRATGSKECPHVFYTIAVLEYRSSSSFHTTEEENSQSALMCCMPSKHRRSNIGIFSY